MPAIRKPVSATPDAATIEREVEAAKASGYFVYYSGGKIEGKKKASFRSAARDAVLAIAKRRPVSLVGVVAKLAPIYGYGTSELTENGFYNDNGAKNTSFVRLRKAPNGDYIVDGKNVVYPDASLSPKPLRDGAVFIAAKEKPSKAARLPTPSYPALEGPTTPELGGEESALRALEASDGGVTDLVDLNG